MTSAPEPARTVGPATPLPSPRRIVVAGALELVLPGVGHLLLRRRRAALLFFVPVAVLIAGLLALYATGGFTAILAWMVTPGVLTQLAAINIALALWRVAAVVDATRATRQPRETFAILGPVALILVLAPHVWLGSTIAATDDYLNSAFANGPDATEAPEDTPPPSWTYAPDAGWTYEPTLPPGATAGPTKKPSGPFTAGTGTLPALNAAVPWTRPGEIPWGNDGKFDLLLLGSDAAGDRWSRRMDVMLLVEIDVPSGKVAMIGVPRNLVNAPFPPGPARDAVACGCFRQLLNALYVEATVSHPDRWPGTGAVSGIGAVRAVVSELVGRPIDAVLVADLWGVIKVVDAMGGIDINIPSGVYDARYPDPVYGKIEMSLPAGQQHLDGRHALFYARSRHQDSDYGRMARQQTLLLAIRHQIGPDDILHAPDLFDAAKGFTWTDLPRSSLPNLVTLFGRAQTATVKHLRIVPPTYPSWLTEPEITQIRKAVAALLGTLPPPTAPPTAAPSPSPTEGGSPSPSLEPSPSAAPTTTPTAAPTAAPTAPPTAAPTAAPTAPSSPGPTGP